MKHHINPTVDCVFKAILGAQENKNLLIDFLNGVLNPISPILDVEILNPYNEKEFFTDKLTIVDLKAQDDQNTIYQIEVQLASFSYLPQRILYTWSDIYQAQLQSGEGFTDLCPVISIWLLTQNLFLDNDAFHHHFQLYDSTHHMLLSNHCSIHLLELDKWRLNNAQLPEEHWYYFFKEAENWNGLPSIIDIPEMRQAMEVLERFSEKERDYHLYQSRQNWLREEKSRQELLEAALQKQEEALQKQEEALQKQEEALQKQEEERKQKEEAQKEAERLRILLEKAGINPDE